MPWHTSFLVRKRANRKESLSFRKVRRCCKEYNFSNDPNTFCLIIQSIKVILKFLVKNKKKKKTEYTMLFLQIFYINYWPTRYLFDSPDHIFSPRYTSRCESFRKCCGRVNVPVRYNQCKNTTNHHISNSDNGHRKNGR